MLTRSEKMLMLSAFFAGGAIGLLTAEWTWVVR